MISHQIHMALTDTGHLGHIQVIPIKAIAGVAFLHPDTATVFTPIEDATFFRLQLLKAVQKTWKGTNRRQGTNLHPLNTSFKNMILRLWFIIHISSTLKIALKFKRIYLYMILSIYSYKLSMLYRLAPHFEF